MFSENLTIQNKTGLHARPASDLVKLTKNYKSKVEIVVNRDGNETIIDAKSIIMVMAGGLAQGTDIELRCTGEDEAEAGKAIADYIKNLTE